MYEEMFPQANVNVEKWLEPQRKFQALMLDGVEKLTQFQLEAFRSYADLGLKSLREGLEVKDVNDLQGFVGKQGERVRELGEKVQGDAQTLAGIHQELGSEVQKLVRNNLSGLTEAPRASRSSTKSSASAATGSARKSA